MAGETCPYCGMDRKDWPDPEGVLANGKRYCCQGCAEGTECTCPPPNNKAETQSRSDA
jgi:hypothetical protein